ncbi:uncharacterized protein [Physcomitrium patens]|uniref:uncharacterized protein n=1 Tax=Physcomitrium patens TaxID=3218 RepID=UPI00024AEDB0
MDENVDLRNSITTRWTDSFPWRWGNWERARDIGNAAVHFSSSAHNQQPHLAKSRRRARNCTIADGQGLDASIINCVTGVGSDLSAQIPGSSDLVPGPNRSTAAEQKAGGREGGRNRGRIAAPLH